MLKLLLKTLRQPLMLQNKALNSLSQPVTSSAAHRSQSLSLQLQLPTHACLTEHMDGSRLSELNRFTLLIPFLDVTSTMVLEFLHGPKSKTQTTQASMRVSTAPSPSTRVTQLP